VEKNKRLKEYECLGHRKVNVNTKNATYHGDPSRLNRFWVYPKDLNIVTPKWDFRSPYECGKFKLIKKNDSGVVEYECLGHFEGEKLEKEVKKEPFYHGDPTRSHMFWVYPEHLKIITP
jgi:hypothetical protein